MSETERLARLMHASFAAWFNRRHPDADMPAGPWESLAANEPNCRQQTQERYLAVAAAVLVAGYLPPGVPGPAVVVAKGDSP